MKLLNRVLDVIAPNDCLVCGSEGKLGCDICTVDFCSPVPSRCYVCRKLTDEYSVCRKCRTTSKVNNLWVVSEYNEKIKSMIYELKFKCNRSAAPEIALLMAGVLPILPSDTIIVNIPTATSRVRSRSFDHTKLIAKELSAITSLTYVNQLARFGQTRQVGSGRTDRIAQLKDSFALLGGLKSTRVLLVDDMVTTGATIESAATELRKNGVKKVYGVALAQK
jgi:ComF family protein